MDAEYHKTYESLFLPWDIKGESRVIVTLSLNCEFTVSHNSDKVWITRCKLTISNIKRSQLLFLLFNSVTETSLRSYQRPRMLWFLLIPGISSHEGTVHIQHSPTGRFKVPIEFLFRGHYFFYCTFYKIMTRSVLDSMLPRMNTKLKFYNTMLTIMKVNWRLNYKNLWMFILSIICR